MRPAIVEEGLERLKRSIHSYRKHISNGIICIGFILTEEVFYDKYWIINVKDFSFSCRRLLPQNIERIREPLNYVDIIEKNIYNIDSKICGIIDDYKVLRDSQKVADYVIQFLRTYLETIAARIYAYENPDKPTPIRGKDKWYTQYIKALKETNEYGYIWMFHHSLQIVTSHYVPAEDGAVRFMEGHINLLYQLRNHMREMFGLNLMENLEDYPQEKNEELNPYYRKIYNSLREIQVEESAEHTKDRYYIMRKKVSFCRWMKFFLVHMVELIPSMLPNILYLYLFH